MYEPIDPVIPTPRGGWPKAARRVELVGVTQLSEAVYELASLARQTRVGHVAAFEGADLYAYPHQTVAQIERSHIRMRTMAAAGQLKVLTPAVLRWTDMHKVGVVMALRLGMVDRAEVLRTYALSHEELASWEARFEAFGARGLAVNQTQRLRLNPSPDLQEAAHV